MSTVRNADVFYKDYKSDKEYHISIEAASFSTYKVQARFGPRNGTQTHVDLTRGKAVSYTAALALYEKKLNEKLAKGYHYAPSTNSGLIARMKKETGVFLFPGDWQKLADFVLAYVEEVA